MIFVELVAIYPVFVVCIVGCHVRWTVFQKGLVMDVDPSVDKTHRVQMIERYVCQVRVDGFESTGLSVD